ncbi:mitochondrial mRNA pseudouridine synthase RPUSD3 isoform X2 [Oenanthe melanoleuca]|uniref:mitochondrial mRNA pseudouridine synthase RPUSD3 isoform X2 n=1 Tax=Oenanthe melanoleuca TaxID=2939378 RepID=UPI0024C10879|nr:mitochondrial mRNA pseudouridine synthase RPUSD3 isoform X2 [Oenanthe melanoleuca]
MAAAAGSGCREDTLRRRGGAAMVGTGSAAAAAMAGTGSAAAAAARGLACPGVGARMGGWRRLLGPKETLKMLEGSVVHREGALLALNKPPGLPVLGRPGDLSLDALLPALRRCLGLAAELHVVKAPASCYHTTKKLQQFFTNARWKGQYPATYRAITVGVPEEMEGEICTGLRWQQQEDRAVVVAMPAPGRRSLARKDVKNTLTRYRVLSAVGGCALLQLQPRTAFPEQLQVHLTLLLCPALGDHKHSSQVGKVLGVPFFLSPETAPSRTQVLDEELLSRLGLSPQQLQHLPLHIHLQELVLPQGPLCAPPPPYFLHTLRCLGLPEH